MHKPAATSLIAAIEARCLPQGADERDVERMHRACVAFCSAAEVAHVTLVHWIAEGQVVPWWVAKADEHGETFLKVELTEAGKLIWSCRVYADGVGYGRGRAWPGVADEASAVAAVLAAARRDGGFPS